MGHGAATEAASSALGSLRGGDVVMLLITVTVVLRVANYHYFKWPPSIMMAFGSIACTVLLLLGAKLPFLNLAASLQDFRIAFMDFPDLVLNYMLGFLLFAAAIEVDLRALSRIRSTIIALSFFTTFISTALVSVLTYLLLMRTSPMNFAWCLLYGAIVSPTDPVAVISILNDKPGLLPSSTRYFVLGESLLNDAVGVVLYLVFSEIVVQPDMNYMQVASLFFKSFILECFSGIIIGLLLAWIAYSAIKSCNEPLLEIAITFVLVGNINMICRMLHASIPLASVAAGLFIGNYCTLFAMSEGAVETFEEMWKLLDETLNSVLFLLIGFADLFWEPQQIGWSRTFVVAISTICISLLARLISVSCPLFFIIFIEWLTGVRLRHPSVRYRGGTVAVLTWGGMRGGISIALALGVPDAFARHAIPGHMTYGQLIFFMTFSLVVFSICVQGLFFETVVRLINALSYDHFPSGGLGTYASTRNFNYDPEEGSALSDGHDGRILDASGELLMRDGGERINSLTDDLHQSWAAAEVVVPNDVSYPGGLKIPANPVTTDDDEDDGTYDEEGDQMKYGSYNSRMGSSDGVTFADQHSAALLAPPTPSNRKLPRAMPPRAAASSPDASALLLPPPRKEMTQLTIPKSAGPEFDAGRRSRSFAPADDRDTETVSFAPAPQPMALRPQRIQEMQKMSAAERHRRDGSETFKGMGSLQPMPSIDDIWRGGKFWSFRSRPAIPAASESADELKALSSVSQTTEANGARVGAGAGAVADVGGKLRRSHTVHGSQPSKRAAPKARRRDGVKRSPNGSPTPTPTNSPPPEDQGGNGAGASSQIPPRMPRRH